MIASARRVRARVVGVKASNDRRGFTLLEVMLALAILATSLAVLGELARLGLRNAKIARDTTQAQLLCESKLAEVIAGIEPMESVSDASLETIVGDGLSAWLYSVDVQQGSQEGVLAVRVTVREDLPEEQRPVQFSLLRWTVDPETESALAEAYAASEESDSTAAGEESGAMNEGDTGSTDSGGGNSGGGNSGGGDSGGGNTGGGDAGRGGPGGPGANDRGGGRPGGPGANDRGGNRDSGGERGGRGGSGGNDSGPRAGGRSSGGNDGGGVRQSGGGGGGGGRGGGR